MRGLHAVLFPVEKLRTNGALAEVEAVKGRAVEWKVARRMRKLWPEAAVRVAKLAKVLQKAGNFPKLFPRTSDCRRTRFALVRLALALPASQCAWPMRAALWRCRKEPRRSTFPKSRAESENGSRRDLKEGVLRGDGRGCRRGNVVPHNAPAFPCTECSPLEK